MYSIWRSSLGEATNWALSPLRKSACQKRCRGGNVKQVVARKRNALASEVATYHEWAPRLLSPDKPPKLVDLSKISIFLTWLIGFDQIDAKRPFSKLHEASTNPEPPHLSCPGGCAFLSLPVTRSLASDVAIRSPNAHGEKVFRRSCKCHRPQYLYHGCMTGTLSQGRSIPGHNALETFSSNEIHRKDLSGTDCNYPPCYVWSETNVRDCNFNEDQQTDQAPVTACSGWFLSHVWYKLQFQPKEHATSGLRPLKAGGTCLMKSERRFSRQTHKLNLQSPWICRQFLDFASSIFLAAGVNDGWVKWFGSWPG